MKIYALKDRKTDSLGYIGASKHPRKRLLQHMQGSPTPLQQWLNSLDDLPEIIILEDVPPETDWRLREQYWIGKYDNQNHPLQNRMLPKTILHDHKTCKADGCQRPAVSLGLCKAHYMRVYRRRQKLKPTYQCGLGEGHNRVVDTVNNMLNPHGGSCYLDHNNTVHLEIQGQFLSAPIKAVDET